MLNVRIIKRHGIRAVGLDSLVVRWGKISDSNKLLGILYCSRIYVETFSLFCSKQL
ncbi:hypothetical protein SRABI134_04459 [Peribacillus sp. Bi134]|nr:hypothetical protein SRABI134_04459 [Peribacillus sp. Bi134]